MITKFGCIEYSPQTFLDIYDEVFKRYIKQGDIFVDLGSAKGDVVEVALKYTDKAFGIEVEEQEASKAKVKTVHQNFLDYSYQGINCIFYHIRSSNSEDILVEKLKKEFEGILILADFNNDGRLENFGDRLKATLKEKKNNIHIYESTTIYNIS